MSYFRSRTFFLLVSRNKFLRIKQTFCVKIVLCENGSVINKCLVKVFNSTKIFWVVKVKFNYLYKILNNFVVIFKRKFYVSLSVKILVINKPI